MSDFKGYDFFIKELKSKVDNFDFKAERKEFGRVISVGDGIAQVDGLTNIGLGEAVSFLNDGVGIVMGLEPSFVHVILLNKQNEVFEGVEVFRCNHFIQIPVSDSLLGRVVNPLGEPIDGMGPIDAVEHKNIDNPSPTITQRRSVSEPFQTGIKVIDSLIPIGLGQRQLILGDRQSGKTAILVDSILNQKSVKELGRKFAYCVYVAIGQKASDVAKLYRLLKESGAMEYSVIVAATSSDSAAMQYIAPMAGATIGEYFRDTKRNSVVMLDDLSKHSDVYREISLLMRRSPGRGAYPGDIFYLHSKLLERAACLNLENGGGSMTMLPVIQTQAGDISEHIPTTVISITDGQISLDKKLFFEGQKPAVNIGFSVSRIGSAAQYKGMKKVSGRLKGELAQYKEYKNFAKSVSDLDQETKNILDRGNILMNSFKQPMNSPMSFEKMIFTLFVHTHGLLSSINLKEVKKAEAELINYVQENEPDIFEHIIENLSFNEEIEEKMKKAVKFFLSRY